MSALVPNEEGLRDSKGIEQTETGTADIKRAAIFADEQPGMDWAESDG